MGTVFVFVFEKTDNFFISGAAFLEKKAPFFCIVKKNLEYECTSHGTRFLPKIVKNAFIFCLVTQKRTKKSMKNAQKK